VYQYIIEQIKNAVEEERIKPGEKLPSERALAEILNVSRTSVKEAITVLESSGIVNVRPGVGMFLSNDPINTLGYKFSKIVNKQLSDFSDLIELRQAIEGDAAYYAAKRITDEQKEKLTLIFKKLIRLEQKGEVAIEEDFQFHATIVEASNNPMMLEAMNVIAQKMLRGLRESRHTSIQDDLLNNAVLEEHTNIYKAILNNEPEQARSAMWQHHHATNQRYVQASVEKDGGTE